MSACRRAAVRRPPGSTRSTEWLALAHCVPKMIATCTARRAGQTWCGRDTGPSVRPRKALARPSPLARSASPVRGPVRIAHGGDAPVWKFQLPSSHGGRSSVRRTASSACRRCADRGPPLRQGSVIVHRRRTVVWSAGSAGRYTLMRLRPLLLLLPLAACDSGGHELPAMPGGPDGTAPATAAAGIVSPSTTTTIPVSVVTPPPTPDWRSAPPTVMIITTPPPPPPQAPRHTSSGPRRTDPPAPPPGTPPPPPPSTQAGAPPEPSQPFRPPSSEADPPTPKSHPPHPPHKKGE
jgi:hypothetical protein